MCINLYFVNTRKALIIIENDAISKRKLDLVTLSHCNVNINVNALLSSHVSINIVGNCEALFVYYAFLHASNV